MLLLIELPLAKKVEMNGLSAFPRVSELFISRSTNVTSDQTVHSLGHICCSDTRACYLSHLGVKQSLFIGVYFESSQHIDLFDQ